MIGRRRVQVARRRRRRRRRRRFVERPGRRAAHDPRVARGHADEPAGAGRAAVRRAARGGHRRDPRVRRRRPRGPPLRRARAPLAPVRPRRPAHRALGHGRQPERHPCAGSPGARARTGVVVDPGGARSEARARARLRGRACRERGAGRSRRCTAGKKRLVFVDSRRGVGGARPASCASSGSMRS